MRPNLIAFCVAASIAETLPRWEGSYRTRESAMLGRGMLMSSLTRSMPPDDLIGQGRSRRVKETGLPSLYYI
jgi:hypothetical protein